MSNNDQIILDEVVKQRHAVRAPTSSVADFFEMFVASEILKDFDLSDEEIEAGIVAGGGDGGIDGTYIFANGELVQDDFDFSTLKRSVVIEVHIFQAKLTAGFDEEAINKLYAVTRDLFDLTKNLKDFSKQYNEDVIAAADVFRSTYTGLAARFPALKFAYYYATRGDSATVHPNVRKKVTVLGDAISSLYSAASFEFRFLGAKDLLELARRQPVTSFTLNVAESISAQDGYISLVRLRDYAMFIRDEKGALRKNLFESNVRDYQGSTVVNAEIQTGLRENSSEDFWWLNNGVTIIAGKAVQSGKTLTIENPQIVNGLQTSTEIFNYYKDANTENDKRHVMVRVIAPTKLESNDKIIKATNSQTSIPPASLRATDKVHRDIEEYLKAHNLYYDRRKNMYRNEGKPIEQIVSIPLLAQAIMATCLQRPNDARARPSSLLKKDDDYSKIFDPAHPIALYLVAASLIKAVQSNLRARADLSPKDRNNLLFYVAMYVASALTGVSKPTAAHLAGVKLQKIESSVISAGYEAASKIYQSLGASDQAAKGIEFPKRMAEKLTELLNT